MKSINNKKETTLSISVGKNPWETSNDKKINSLKTDDQLTTIEKLALKRGLERVNRNRDSQQEKIISILDSLDTKSNFCNVNNLSKLQELFSTIQGLKRVYPSREILWKAPSNNLLPPYKSARLENKILKRGLKKRCPSHPNSEKIVEKWYELMKVPENMCTT